jgi:hypothetical protein
MFGPPTFRGLLRLSVSSAAGTLVGGVLATAWIAVLNLRAEDGPYFPPPLVALVLVLPVTLTLLPFQALVELVSARSRRLPWWIVELLAVAGGLSAATLLFAFLLERPSKEPATVAAILALALLQGFVTLSCMRWLAPRRARP